MQSTLDEPAPASQTRERDSVETRLPGLFTWRGVGQAVLAVNCLVLFAAAIGLRCWRLGSLPGVNGDEAWMGVNALQFLHGDHVFWRTPSGNLLNPFLFLPQVLLHAIFSPSFTLLRIPAVVSGILALIVNFGFCRRVFGRQAAVISTLMLAVLPINIAYSRFAWDACQSLLFTLPCVYLPLMAASESARRRRWICWSVAALGAAIWVHPTNCLVAPLLAAPWVMDWRRLAAAPSEKNFLAARNARILLLVMLGGAIVAWRILRLFAYGSPQWEISIAELLVFAFQFLNFFAGDVVYDFISGSQGSMASLLCVALTALIGVFGLIGRCGRRAPDTSVRCGLIQSFCCCWIIFLVGFFLVAGEKALEPHSERYGICLIGPTAILVTLGLQWWLLRWRFFGSILLTATAWTLVAGFYGSYVQSLLRGESGHPAFATAEIEPKQSAWEYVATHRDPARHVEIVTEDWWSYWPLRYLAYNEQGVTVRLFDDVMQPIAELTRAQPVAPNRVVLFDVPPDQSDHWAVALDERFFSTMAQWEGLMKLKGLTDRRIDLFPPSKHTLPVFLYHAEPKTTQSENSSPNPENN